MVVTVMVMNNLWILTQDFPIRINQGTFIHESKEYGLVSIQFSFRIL